MKHASDRVGPASHLPSPKATPSGAKPFDFRIIDKAHFKCFEMADGTIYYGEVAYVSKENPQQLYHSIEEVPSANVDDPVEVRERLVYPVRHGFGIQLYGRNPEAGDKLCYYSGKWERDQKSGDGGVQIYPDGISEY